MTNLDLIDWTIESAARVRSERADAAHPTDPRRPLDKLLAELESDPAELAVRPAPPELRSNIIVVDSTQHTTLSTAQPASEGMRAEVAEPPLRETARTEPSASAERFAALEKRYASHLSRLTRAPLESATMPADSSPEAHTVAPKPGLLRAIVEPTIHTARADRNRAVDLRWILRGIRNQRPRRASGVEDDLGVLIEFGLVEMRDGEPVLTSAGLKAIA